MAKINRLKAGSNDPSQPISSQRSELRTDDARLPFSQNGRDLYMDYVAYLVRNHRTDEALDVIDQGRAETLAEGLGFENKGTSSDQSPADISYWTLARQSHAVILVYAMSPQGPICGRQMAESRAFTRFPIAPQYSTAVASHRRASPRSQRPRSRTASRGAHLVRDAGKASRAPHPSRRSCLHRRRGGLNGLNFETLLTPGVQPLLDRGCHHHPARIRAPSCSRAWATPVHSAADTPGPAARHR